MRGTTPEEQIESDRAAKLRPQNTAEGRRAALTVVLLVAGTILLAFVRPRMAGTIAVFAAIILMIMLHELGHFLTAKWAGMKVTEFFLGFGPRLWSFRRGETEYGVKAIPAGGYVKIIGMNNLERGRPRRRAPHLPPEALLATHVGGRGRLDHALPHRLRPLLHA